MEVNNSNTWVVLIIFMVLLSVAIVNKTGRPVVARQYLEVSKEEIEGLLTGFGKLIDTYQKKSEANYIETHACRYLYQPLSENQLFLLAITTKHSNVLEDLDTLRLLYRVTADVVSTGSAESAYLQKAFDLVFAFDEVVTFGRREAATLAQVKAGLEMDSHEERLHLLIEKSKENEAKEIAKRKQAEFAKLKAEQAKAAASTAATDGISIEPTSSHFGQPVAMPEAYRPSREISAALPSQPVLTPWTPGESSGVTKTLGASKKGISLGKSSRPTNF
jgi:hypothetical protein